MQKHMFQMFMFAKILFCHKFHSLATLAKLSMFLSEGIKPTSTAKAYKKKNRTKLFKIEVSDILWNIKMKLVPLGMFEKTLQT